MVDTPKLSERVRELRGATYHAGRLAEGGWGVFATILVGTAATRGDAWKICEARSLTEGTEPNGEPR